MDKRFIKFIFVGILNTIIGYGTYSLLVFLKINYIIANTISTIIGIICSYLLNKKITFNDTKTTKNTPIKFISVYILSYIIGTINLTIIVNKCNANEYIAGFINLFITTFISWFGHKYFSFKERKK